MKFTSVPMPRKKQSKIAVVFDFLDCIIQEIFLCIKVNWLLFFSVMDRVGYSIGIISGVCSKYDYLFDNQSS